MIEHVYHCVSFMSGIGFGTKGAHRAEAILSNHRARFGVPLGIDFDRGACAQFERITGGHALRADFHQLQPADILRFVGPYIGNRAPLMVLSSPPCKPNSQLTSIEKANEPEYRAMQELYLKGLNLAVSTWSDGPAVLAFENVRGILSRGRKVLADAKATARERRYVCDERVFDCGKVGGTGAHRPRHILIARRPDLMPQVIGLPPNRPMRSCGDVLKELPLPNTPAAGSLHRLQNLELITWLRLAFVRAGADHRSIPEAIKAWNSGVLRLPHTTRRDSYGVSAFEQPARTVRGRADVRTGAAAVADPRVSQLLLGRTADNAYDDWKGRPGLLGVNNWDKPAPTVTGKMATTSSNAPAAVADQRVNRLLLGCEVHNGSYGVQSPDAPATTVTGTGDVHNGTHGYAAPAPAPPWPPEYMLLTVDAALDMLAAGIPVPKGRIPVILSPWDGCWHRPFTELELALLQTHPAHFDDGTPFDLGNASRKDARMWIGNAIPCDSATAWCNEILMAALRSELGLYSLTQHGSWVQDDGGEPLEVAHAA
jgi:site-specific DNA-cytosine methylase